MSSDVEDPCVSDDETQLIEGDDDGERYRMPDRYGRGRLPRDAVVVPGTGECCLAPCLGGRQIGNIYVVIEVLRAHQVGVRFLMSSLRVGRCLSLRNP